MNDDSEEESGFLKKILATRKDDINTGPSPGPSEDQKNADKAEIDSLLKRIGLPNAEYQHQSGDWRGPRRPAAWSGSGT